MSPLSDSVAQGLFQYQLLSWQLRQLSDPALSRTVLLSSCFSWTSNNLTHDITTFSLR